MDKKIIDNIAWWIPFKSLRNSIRAYLNSISNIEDNMLFLNNILLKNSENVIKFEDTFLERLYNLFKLSNNYNLCLKNIGDGNLIPIYYNDIFNYNNLNNDNFTIYNLFDLIKNEFDIEKLKNSYFILNDEYSKNMFLSSIISRVSHYNGLLISLYYSNSWKYYDELINMYTDEISINDDIKLYLFDLMNTSLKKNIKLYYTPRQLFETYFLEQYRYKNIILAEKDDYIIDGGGCYGDTALYFAELSGEKGKVFSFEFVENNVNIFNKNIELNYKLKERIQLIKKPLYISSNVDLFIDDNGPSSTLNVNGKNKYTTISIDDFVKDNNIKRIDFIKLDIEGSELFALKGAENTIIEYKPKLAICLYHQNSDFYNIPIYLNKIVPKYKFYFDHFSLNNWSSILFAKIDK